MEPNTEDDDLKICTVFSSDTNSSKTIFDTIAFTSPKKEAEDRGANNSHGTQSSSSAQLTSSSTASATSLFAEDSITSGKDGGQGDDTSLVSLGQKETEDSVEEDQKLNEAFDGLEVSSGKDENGPTLEDVPLPCANVLFANAPEVPFPIGLGSTTTEPQKPVAFQEGVPQLGSLGPSMTGVVSTPSIDSVTSAYSSADIAYDAWIPTDETRKILGAITTGVQDPAHLPQTMTMPGIIHEQDMFDKVAVNMARIFGEAEADRRKILDVNSVTQDDNGLRELIKLGCYRSAINLTKRILTLYGQGAGRIGQFTKHTPHSLQIWYTRIALLVRIREFTVADAEIEAFKNFENPDMYYEYYPELYSRGCRGSMVPFHFRLLAAEIPQYMRKTNETYDKLTHILTVARQIISNVSEGLCEDGNPIKIDDDRKKSSLEVWTRRELRVLYSLANAAIFCKDFNGAVVYLSELIQKDTAHEMQLKSSLGRLFLQFGDIGSAERYFAMATELCDQASDVDRADILADAGLLAIGQNNYAQALKCFQDALKIQPENYMLVNNVAVCLVYLGRVKDALSLMESTVKQNTPQLLQENVILNLSTIYELENSDGSKKNTLLKLISEYKGDGINLASLKMPNLV